VLAGTHGRLESEKKSKSLSLAHNQRHSRPTLSAMVVSSSAETCMARRSVSAASSTVAVAAPVVFDLQGLNKKKSK
jgi:hypothetical protein